MIEVLHGDCLGVLPTMDANSVDAIVTDPPAGISFMGKEWDHNKGGRDEWIRWMESVATQCLRVVKPGGHLLVWALPRTSHWTATAWENAGFEVRDRIAHVFGSGFPKSHNLHNEWEGWGTALKPAVEDWWLLRKPLSEKTVAQNVQKWGCGVLNIDGCRVEGGKGNGVWGSSNKTVNADRTFVGSPDAPDYRTQQHPKGRWPANILHDGSGEVLELFPRQAGAFAPVRGTEPSTPAPNGIYGKYGRHVGPFHGDSGSAARFFYCAKASRTERNEGLEDFPEKDLLWSSGTQSPGTFQSEGTLKKAQNFHPTVKPIALMRYLCRLVTPPNGLILDPFCGSGSTGKAAIREGFRFIGIEKEAEYVAIARARCK